MTKNEVAWGAGSLVVGIIVGALLLRQCDRPRPKHTSSIDDTSDVPLQEIPASDAGDAALGDAFADEPLPEPSAPPAHPPRPHHHDASTPKEAAPPDATQEPEPLPSHDAGHAPPPPAVLSEQNLLIRPVSSPGACVDDPGRSSNLTLHGCHGRLNQRWTFTEDTSGASQISGGGGGCIHLGRARGENVPVLQIGACGAGTARFRHTEDRRLVDVQSGQCVTTTSTVSGSHPKLVLMDCDASNPLQKWALTE
jgi:hypothetical protein